MPIEVTFTEEQQVIGHVNTHSGSVALIDGIVESELKFTPNSYVAIDVNLDKKRIPVIATIQGGRRYLLLPLDAAEPIPAIGLEKVDTEDPVNPTTTEKNSAE